MSPTQLEQYIADREQRERRDAARETKKRALWRAIDGGLNCAEAAKEIGVKPDTARKWLKERT